MGGWVRALVMESSSSNLHPAGRTWPLRRAQLVRGGPPRQWPASPLAIGLSTFLYPAGTSQAEEGTGPFLISTTSLAVDEEWPITFVLVLTERGKPRIC